MGVKLIVTILVIAATINAFYAKQDDEETKEVYRIKQNDDIDTRQQENSTSTETSKRFSPCDPYVSEKPNFSSGRRISEAKCLEYIWELKERDAKEKRYDECKKEEAKSREKANMNYVPFVIRGRLTQPGEFPHMGALGWKAVEGTWIFKCGSTLISHKFLVTAGHCSKVSSRDTSVANTRPEIVRLGDKNILDHFANGLFPKDAKILRMIVHPQYNPPKKYFDIALVEIEERVTFNEFLQPACLWTSHDTSPLGTKASLTGWGVIDAATQQTSPELQATIVDIIDSDFCDELLSPVYNRHFRGIHPTQLCAGVLAGGTDSCQGDSGGPLQVKIELPVKTQGSMSYLIGVTSFGFGCARAYTPGVYTRVSSFVDWIESIVWS